jgi:osmotically-inducible protein OsmY
VTDREPEVYLVEHIREALAHDASVAELGICVAVAGDSILLTGDVATPERKAAATQVVERLAEGRTVHNSLTVTVVDETDARENIS